ncbi:hypothetical protein O6H91_17G083300 [Diphasiastrum complanatum]|uniref:Uncharacterized protein n=4 Tax=Diphasiastrum complanatum TaxID=34168 RepID=A0ACC2B8Q2_DIPCM|nr:hypothetical protein O6H91_17G083300 [Diphasiastrum complanatum]KAJ7526131.1 hypothetical protein O6H91_17G083300 [Diphasiastrum complanatum]
MVVRDGGGGLGPLESNLEDCCCFRSENGKASMENDSGSLSNGDASGYTSCLRQCHNWVQSQHSAGANGRNIIANGSEAGRNGASQHSRLDIVARGMEFDAGRFRGFVHGGGRAKEPANANPRNRAKGSALSRSKKKVRNNSVLPFPNSTIENRFTSLGMAVENGEASSLQHKSPEFAEKPTTEDAQIKATETNNSLIPGLEDDVVQLCLVRLSRSLYGSYHAVSKRFCELFRSGELYKLRRDLGISEQWVYLLNSGQSAWRAFNPKDGGRWRPLPPTPSDECFVMCDKESLCAGTQLLVIGREIQGLVVWRYDLISDSWFHGPQMITPRCLYASASWGEYGFVAGGVDSGFRVTNCAERYNSLTGNWESLPPMIKQRKLCSGFYMDGKFWVIGGVDEKDTLLTCGEHYDLKSETWTHVPDMFPSSGDTSRKAPPLVAVVENQLYALDVFVNQLKLYCKRSNTWKPLGDVPVRADFNNGWGLAFKALDGQLVLIGGRCPPGNRDGDAIYGWKPSSDEEPPEWSLIAALVPQGTFVFNCAVMSA